MTYRFIRIKWEPADGMSAVLNTALRPGERVVSHSADRDEVLVLVEVVEMDPRLRRRER